MRRMISFALLFSFIFPTTGANAQVEISQLLLKNYVSLATGAFLDVSIQAPGHGNRWMIEPGMEYYIHRSNYAFLFPSLVGIRHMLNSGCGGMYAEPLAGYMFGSTTIPRTDAAGKPVTNATGDTLAQKGNGLMAGMGVGYAFPNSFYNVELRYEHAFLSGHPQLDILALRFAYTIAFPLKHRRGDE